MEPIQAQVTLLTQKVDALHQVIDQVNSRVTEILSTSSQPSLSADAAILDDHHPHVMTTGSTHYSDALLMHKDILMDSTYIDSETAGDDQHLSAEVQVQRLTAQLTAAYNRIAALEEQLLASRVH